MDWFRRFSRMARIALAAKRRPPLDLHDVSIVDDRVWLTDLDELRHMNNGVYLSLLDHARLDLMERSGTWAKMKAVGVYPVVAGQQIAYRKSLQLGQRFQIETRVIGYDDRAAYIEQRVVSQGEVYARAWVIGRFLRRTGGTVSIEELGQIAGQDLVARRAPEWLIDWAAHLALPSTRQPAPSLWE